jgi:hypothetical protein
MIKLGAGRRALKLAELNSNTQERQINHEFTVIGEGVDYIVIGFLF